MITKYALSYHVRDKADNFLDGLLFDSERQAYEFKTWFNDVVEAKGQITVKEIAKKIGKDVPRELDYEFSRIGFAIPLIDSCIIYKYDLEKFYIALPIEFKDFSIQRRGTE